MARRVALLIATEQHQDGELRRLTAPGVDVAALAAVLADPEVAGFDVTTMIDEPHHRVGEALGDFYRDRRADDITLLYFTGHGLKDEDGRLYLAMTNTRRDSLLFTALAADQINQAMARCASRQQVLVLDCCYSGAFPAGQAVKGDSDVHSLERFRGRGRTVLTASDSTRYSFEGSQLHGAGARSVFTRHLVDGLRSGEADLNGDGDITLDELYSYVHDRVVAEQPRQRPKFQADIEGRTVIARNVNWELPVYLRNALRSPIATDRLSALDGLAHLHRIGNDLVRERVVEQVRELIDDDSRSVSAAADATLRDFAPNRPAAPGESRVSSGESRVSSGESHVSSGESRVSSAEPIEEPARDARIPVTSVALLATAAAFMGVGAIPALFFVAGLGGVLAVAGLIAVIVQRKRDQDWVTATAVNLVCLMSIPAVLSVREGRVPVLGLIATANAVVALLVVRRSRASGRRGWWIVPAWTGAVAVAMTVVAIVVATGSTHDSATAASSAPAVTGMAVSADGSRLYLSRSNRSVVTVLDVATRTPIATTVVGGAPTDVLLSPDGKRLYVSNSIDSTVTVVDTATNATVGKPIPTVPAPQELAISPDGTRLFVASSTSWWVSVIDTATLAPARDSFGVGIRSGASLRTMVMSPDGAHLYIGIYTSAVADVDPVTGLTARQIEVPNPYATALAVSPDGKRLYVGTRTGLLVIDARTGVPIGGIIPVGQGPVGLVLGADGKRLYTGDGAGGVVVVDAEAAATVGAPVPVGGQLGGMALSPDGHHLYVATGFGDTVTVIDTASRTVSGAPIAVA